MGHPLPASAGNTALTAWPAPQVPLASVTPLAYHQAWVFDFDGTLIDSMGAFCRLAAEILATRYDVPFEIALQQYRTTSGLPFVQQVEQLYPGDPRNPATVAEFETRKQALFYTALPFPDTVDLLIHLKRRGDFVAISSNNFQDLVERRVEELRLPIDLVCGWHDGQGKGRRHFDAVVRKSRVPWQQLTFVGDSLHDAQIAQYCEVRFTARAGTFSRHEFQAVHPAIRVVGTLSELMA